MLGGPTLVWKSRAVLACAICFLLNYANHEADTLMTVPAAPPRSRSRSSCSRPTAGPPTSWPPRRHTRHSACGRRSWRQCPSKLIATTWASLCWTGLGQLVFAPAMETAVQRTGSSLSIKWGSVLPDRSLLRWAAKRLGPFRLPTPTPPPSYPLGLPPFPPGPLAAQTALPERRTFTPQENRIIDAVSSIQPTDPRPPIYDLMMEEGRILPRIEAIVQEAFVPFPDAESSVHIFVSADLMRDVKDLRFGFINDLSFDICHHGISPFTVAAMSHEQASSYKRLHDRMSRVSSLAAADVARMEHQPNPCPRTFDGLLRLVATYHKLLTVLFGTQCSHFLEVRAMRRTLVRLMPPQFEDLPRESIAQILLSVHLDARMYFSAPIRKTAPCRNRS